MAAPWEHKVLTYKLGMKGFDYGQVEEQLNELGRDGWQAVGTLAPSFGAGQAIEIAVILKRAGD
ncbi:DUF4177 domain-containing protein [Streptomyces sp. SID8379]|uniref:DUF4177 domain-containing protein n=1 Tax=unclassified Streptomyces TaxID=2593676 RepID=UPI000365872D|nr:MULTISPECIES: DUF4177 domain-containing protein [unclassified Streptomyces]MYW63737.1 DUF4177 domain-containing protein [Streptomyces sp. SID8379]